MKKKDSFTGAIILLVILILITIFYSVFVIYEKKYKLTDEPEAETKVIIDSEKKALEKDLNDLTEPFSKIILAKKEDSYQVVTDSNLLTDSNKQLFVFAYLESNSLELEDYLYVKKDDLTVQTAKDENSLEYLNITLYNGYYKKFFGGNIDVSKKINSTYNTKYDTNGYVYYNLLVEDNQYKIESFKVNDAVYDNNTKLYSATITLKCNDNLSTLVNINSMVAIVEYGISEENIYYTKFKIKS